ncbi:hypothetical protein [Paenibacillus sinopodophylli]|uniref:hypothetical protein n=1 Tax=Paenibacillus sinopodophylli TaxID=1837342 RepID=UPI00110CE269|nr:hypothetical protein [Paenibacillus sinopodophylli]
MFFLQNGGAAVLNVFITVKSLGKRKSYLDRLPWTLKYSPDKLKALIEDIVLTNVRQLNERETDMPLASFLSTPEIELKGAGGKVSFGTRYHDNKADEEEAVATALLAFEDGLFKVFINGREAETLETKLALANGDELAFIRFTMLAGRMW